MCGICGIYSPDGRTIEPKHVERMRDAMQTRGPDGFGLKCGQGFAFGHRRLAIIDLSDDGRQPMTNEDGSVIVTFNGEIYNFGDLRPELVSAGHVFHSKSDTEVLIHGYEEWGMEELLKRIRGMFAFALLDSSRKRLYLVRDPFGKKPLFFQWKEGELVFASSARAMTQALPSMPEVDLAAIDDLIWNNHIPGRKTIFSSVEKILPGHAWQLNHDGTIREWAHWQPNCFEPEYGVSEEAWLDRMECVLETAVRRRFVSDVPVGTMLSGGIDSGLVTALAAKALGQVQTFTVASDDPVQNESGLAAMVANRYHTDHHVLAVKSDVRRDLIRLVSAMGEPFADSSAINVFGISELAKQWITVVLTGDGGDEGFGGYQSFFAVHCAEQFSRGMPLFVRPFIKRYAESIDRRFRSGVMHKLGTLLRIAAESPENFCGRLSPDLNACRNGLFTKEMHMQLAGRNPFGHIGQILAENRYGTSWADRMMDVFFRTTLADDFLTKVDLATMGVSMEARCPFLDVDVVDLAFRIPVSMRFRGFQRKGLLRRLAKRHLPVEIVDRRKQGFTVAVDLWFRDQWTDIVNEFILGPHVEQRGWFRRESLQQIVDEHRSGINRSGQLWALLVLELWLRLTIDGTLSATDVL